ncbi:Sulfurtransferase TusE [Buchnera aphidicola (Pemphigus populi)]
MIHTHKKKNKHHSNNNEKYKTWNKYIGEQIAKKKFIKMSPQHWEIIYIVRKFYVKFKITPSMRMLLAYIEKKNKKKINSQYLFILFSDNAIVKISAIAGVPKPKSCL